MTLQRTLEPEVMDSNQEADAYDQMDHSEVNRQFVTDLLSFLQTLPEYAEHLQQQTDSDELLDPIDVLDVGTATAQIPIELCQRSDEVRVMAIDLAVSMLELARYNVEAASQGHRIELVKMDAKSMAYPDGTFDVVMSNSIIHHIPDPESCLAEIVRVCRPGSAIFIRDLMRPDDATTVDQLVQTYAGEESELCQTLFHASLHASLSLEEIQHLVQKLGFAPDSVFASSDRHWTWSVLVDE